MNSTPKPTRPALRYFGGKWLLAEWIISHFPPHRVYVELFAGAASVLLRKPRSYAEVYNDLFDQVVTLFRVLQNPAHAAELERLLRLTPFARKEFQLAYKKTSNPIEKSRRLIIRSFMGFGANGVTTSEATGFRSNSNRSGTTPAHDWLNYPDQIQAFCERLSGVVIESRNAADLAPQHDSPETLFYVDPPYPFETRGPQHRYAIEMTDADHIALAETLRQVEGMVVLSSYPSPLYNRIYSGWTCITRSSLADGARPRVETLWLNPAAAAKNPQPNLL